MVKAAILEEIARVSHIPAANRYALLDVGRDAAPKEIRAAYLKMMKLLHPDKTGAAAPDTHPTLPSPPRALGLRGRTAGCVVQASSTGVPRPTGRCRMRTTP